MVRGRGSRTWLAFGAFACALMLGCVEPTAVRRTLLIPTATLPARLGAPLEVGHGRAGIEVTGGQLPAVVMNLDPYFDGVEGDPGVLIPNLQLGGFVYVGLLRVWELGARFSYAHASWADRNVRGVLDLPESQDRGLYQLGLGSRFNLLTAEDLDVPFNLALLTELNLTSMPEAVFCMAPCPGTVQPPAPGAPDYLVHDTNRELALMPQLALSLGVSVTEAVFVDAIFGATTSMRNIGFDRLENLNDDTNHMFWLGYAGAGVDLRYDAVFVTFHLYVPFEGQRKIDFGARTALQAGYAF